MRDERISNIDLYRALDPFQSLFREPLWAFGQQPRLLRRRNRQGPTPFSIEEDDGAYELRAELPGVGEEHLEIEVTRDRLRLGVLESEHVRVVPSAEPSADDDREDEEASVDHGDGRDERRWRLRREFSFAEALDAGSVSASIKHGVLSVRLPKLGAVSARKVPILTG
jgi:HSP20 family protein